jgi:hypothetical protein
MSLISVPIAIGLALLLFGYRYYWLIAAGVAFLFGLDVGSAPDGGQITSSAIVMGVIFALVAAVAAVFVTNLALNVAGFLIGGVLAVNVFNMLGWDVGSNLAAFLLGGVIGLLLAIFASDFAKIILSVITGAGIILSAVELEEGTMQFAYIALVITGIVAQLFLRQRFK